MTAKRGEEAEQPEEYVKALARIFRPKKEEGEGSGGKEGVKA